MQALNSVDKPVALSTLEPVKEVPANQAIEPQKPSQEADNKPGEQGQRLAILGRWALAADLSKRISMHAQTERTIRTLYQNLEKLKRHASTEHSFTKAAAAIQGLLQESQSVQAAPHSGLEESLALSDYQTSNYRALLPSQLDLLSSKNLPEEISILLGRSGKAVQLQLPANQNRADNLAHIQQQFAPLGIQVRESSQGLEFQAPLIKQRLLKENWQLTGQGVRVAAGNAVQIKLGEPKPPLEQLMPEQEPRQHTQYLRQIEQAQQKLKESLAKLRHSQTELRAQLQELQWNQQAADTQALEQQAKQLLKADSLSKTQLIMAQTGINLSFVSYGLG